MLNITSNTLVRKEHDGWWAPVPEAELWLLVDEESLSSLEDSELLSLLSEPEAEESDSAEEDAEEEEEGEELSGSISGFCATMTFGVFLRCSRNSSLIKNIMLNSA